jgi:glycosyltransferase involved in cell wall biosynthesis
MNMISRELAFPAVSIVIPVFNEQNNITPLIQRLKLTCEASSLLYEVIIIDDKSVDNTWSEIVSLIKSYPIRAYKKSGERGKAQSLLEGFAHVKSPIIAMIDGDLQYPPEAIPEMVKQIIFNNVDVVVANRKTSQGSKIRRFVSTTYRLMFGKILWRLDLDVQSGLKVFKTEIIKRMDLHPQPWTFDLEFLVKSKNAGYKIG